MFGENVPSGLLEKSASSISDLLVGVATQGVAGLLLDEVES